MSKLYIYLILAASVSALATDMIVPALPVLQKSLNADYSTVQLTISGFLIIYAFSQLLSGFASEKLRKIPVMTGSFIIFMAGSVVCFLAESIPVLMFGRGLQAIGAGAGPVLSKAIARDSFSPLTLKRTLSDIASASAVVSLIAPLLGGLILDHMRWNEIFLVMAIFSVITVYLTPRSLSEHTKFDPPSATSEKFITPDFIQGTILVSLMLSSLFCYISLSPAIFIDTFKISAINYSLLFSVSVLAFIAGNQFSRIEKMNNPYVLFLLNAFSLLPFLTESQYLFLCVTGAIIFNFTLGAYYPTANYIALQIKGRKTGMAASVTGFIQTVSAGGISLLAVNMTDLGFSFNRMLGISALFMAALSMMVIITMKVNKWKTGKKAKLPVH